MKYEDGLYNLMDCVVTSMLVANDLFYFKNCAHSSNSYFL